MMRFDAPLFRNYETIFLPIAIKFYAAVPDVRAMNRYLDVREGLSCSLTEILNLKQSKAEYLAHYRSRKELLSC